MIIKKKHNKKSQSGEQESIYGNGEENLSDNSQHEIDSEDEEIDLFNLDNIDFKQRNERRKGDRRRGFRRIDDRNLISRAKEEAYAIKEAAAKEGYDAGMQEVHEDMERVKEALGVFFNAPQEVYDSIAPDILQISLDIAKKIIKKESVENQDIILENIKDILKTLSKEETKLTLNVNPNQAQMLKQEVPEIARSLGLEVKLYVVPDEGIMEGGCVLTTTNGVIDASIEAQLAIISEVLKGI